MSETFHTENIYSEQSTSHEVDNLRKKLGEKILAAWGSARDQLGTPNNHRLAELLYKSIFTPHLIVQEEVAERPGFERSSVLKEVLPIGPTLVPSEAEFIQTVRHALTSETNFQEALVDNAHEVVANLAKLGPVTIWTTGDVYGHPDQSYHGSHEQYKRIAISGFNDLRKKLGKETKQDYHDVISVRASENKFALLPEILDKYQQSGISTVVVLEDRAKNIEKVIVASHNYPELTIFPIWIRQGLAKNSIPKSEGKTQSEWETEFHAVDSLSEVINKLQEYGIKDESKLGFIIDYDDVLSNDFKRQELQVQTLIEVLEKKGWI